MDEANRMLRSLQETDPKEKTMITKNSEDKMFQLQKQLDEMKDHSEVFSSLKGAVLALAGSLTVVQLIHFGQRLPEGSPWLINKSHEPQQVIIGGPGAGPIVSMGLLTNCKITWDGEALQVCILQWAFWTW